MDKKAEVDVVIGGADKVKKDLDGIADSADKLSAKGKKAESAWKEVGKSIGNSVETLASDFMRLVSVGSLLNFKDAISGAKVFEQGAQRLATATGASFESVKRRIDSVGGAIGVTREQSIAWEQAILKSTRSVSYARDSMRAFQEQALASGESLQEQVPLAKVLKEAFQVDSNSSATSFFERLTAQAKELGTVGGPEALKDQIIALGPALEQVSMKTQKAKGDMTALLAGIGAKTSSPAQANRVAQSLIGTIEGRATDVSYRLGIPLDQLVDEEGHIKNVPEVLSKVKKQAHKRFGKNSLRALMNTFGGEGGSFLFRNDPAAFVDQASNLIPERAGATNSFMASDAGRTLSADIGVDRRNQDNAAPAIAVERFMKEHPILSTLGALVGKDVVGTLLKKGGGTAAGKAIADIVKKGGGRTIGRGLSRGLGGAAAFGLDMALMTYEAMDNVPAARAEIENTSRGAFDLQRQGQAQRAVALMQGSDSVPEFLRRANSVGFGSVFSQGDLKGAATAAETGQIPQGLDTALAKALVQAFKSAGVQFTVVVQNQSDSPIQATVKEQGKAGQQ